MVERKEREVEDKSITVRRNRQENNPLDELAANNSDDVPDIYHSTRRPLISNDYNQLRDHSNDLEVLKCKLDYFFMDPVKKWRQKNTRPWKLVIQILKVFVFTSQLVLFGNDMAKFISYKDEMQTTFKQLFLKDWDPSSDAVAYPGPFIPNAVYTKQDFFNSINFAIKAYSNVSQISVGPFGYPTNSSTIVSPIEICTTNFVQANFEPNSFKYNYSMYTKTECKSIENFADAGDEKWLDFDIRDHLTMPINFSTLTATSVSLPLRTLLIEDATTGDAEIACFDVDIEITLDNQHRDGQIIINLSSLPRRAKCDGLLTEIGEDIAVRLILNSTVMLFCILSSMLCIRSLWKAHKLVKYSQTTLRSHGKNLELSDQMEFLDPWLALIILNDLMIAAATIEISFYDQRLLETDNYTICSLLIGLGNLFTWSGLLRYLSYFKKYNILIVTLRKSFPQVMRFMMCTLLIYCGFCFSGWIVFGPYHFKFRRLSTTTECLFSLINGDDMFETFSLLKSEIVSVWWFSRIYLYLFVSLFIYVVLSLFIALIMDAYEIIKQYGDNGFPKTRLQSFYLDGDLSKLSSVFQVSS